MFSHQHKSITGAKPPFASFLAPFDAKAGSKRLEVRNWLHWATEAISEVIWVCNSDTTRILYISPSYERV